jgi:hypothetical protein
VLAVCYVLSFAVQPVAFLGLTGTADALSALAAGVRLPGGVRADGI